MVTVNMDQIEQLLQTPYWIIDILPKQVQRNSRGQYFAVEKYFLISQLTSIKQKHVNLILKLNCYRDVEIEGEKNPKPEKIAEIIRERYVYVIVGNSMILSEPDDTHMTFFNPDDELLSLVKELAAAEGLFMWEGSLTGESSC